MINRHKHGPSSFTEHATRALWLFFLACLAIMVIVLLIPAGHH